MYIYCVFFTIYIVHSKGVNIICEQCVMLFIKKINIFYI